MQQLIEPLAHVGGFNARGPISIPPYLHFHSPPPAQAFHPTHFLLPPQYQLFFQYLLITPTPIVQYLIIAASLVSNRQTRLVAVTETTNVVSSDALRKLIGC